MSGLSLSEEGGVSPTVKTDAPPIQGVLIYVIIGKVTGHIRKLRYGKRIILVLVEYEYESKNERFACKSRSSKHILESKKCLKVRFQKGTSSTFGTSNGCRNAAGIF